MPHPHGFVDKPVHGNHRTLAHLREGDYLCQPKWDGWNAEINWWPDGHGVSVVSRTHKPLPVSRDVLTALRAVLVRACPMPVTLNGEWMERRAAWPEGFVLFDLLKMDGHWMGQLSADERWSMLCDLFEGKVAGPVQLVACRRHGYSEMFEWSKTRPELEGVVLKHVEGRLIGHPDRSAENPRIIKCKYREGADGKTLVGTGAMPC